MVSHQIHPSDIGLVICKNVGPTAIVARSQKPLSGFVRQHEAEDETAKRKPSKAGMTLLQRLRLHTIPMNPRHCNKSDCEIESVTN
eukprot:3176794-Amphidinium_carterae.1